jgi:hypothetical protein
MRYFLNPLASIAPWLTCYEHDWAFVSKSLSFSPLEPLAK